MPHHKEPEYLIPFIPALIVIASLWIINLKKFIIKSIIFIIIILCLIQYFYFSFAANANIFYFNNSFVEHNKEVNKQYINIITELKPYLETKIYFQKTDLDRFKLQLLSYTMNNKNLIGKIYDYYDIDLFYIKLFEENISEDQMNKFFDDVTIVVWGKTYSTLDIAEHIYYFDHDNFGKSDEYKEKFIEKHITRIEHVRKYIDDNFYLNKSFYLGNIENKENLVKIYIKQKNS